MLRYVILRYVNDTYLASVIFTYYQSGFEIDKIIYHTKSAFLVYSFFFIDGFIFV